MRNLRDGSWVHDQTDVEEIVGDYAEPDPALHSVVTLVSAAIETIAPFHDADAALAAGPPFLAVAEPTLLLLALAFGALGRTIGNAHAFDAHRLCSCLVPARVEGGVCCDQSRNPSQPGLVSGDGWDQQVRIVGSPSIDLIVDDDLILGFLQLGDLAEFVGLAGLALANDLGGRLEQAENLALDMRVAVEDAGAGLTHDLPHQRHHPVQLRTQALQRNLRQDIRSPLDARGYLPREPLGLPHHPARRVEQSAVPLSQPVPIERAFGARDAPDLQQPQLHAPAAVAQLGPD